MRASRRNPYALLRKKMSRENPRNQEWAVYYDEHPEVLENWREQHGYPPYMTEEEEAAEVNEGEAEILRRIEEARTHPERGKPRPQRNGGKNE